MHELIYRLLFNGQTQLFFHEILLIYSYKHQIYKAVPSKGVTNQNCLREHYA